MVMGTSGIHFVCYKIPFVGKEMMKYRQYLMHLYILVLNWLVIARKPKLFVCLNHLDFLVSHLFS